MSLQKLERHQWPAFCNHLSVGLMGQGQLAEVEIASPAIGAQIEVRWVPIIGLAYDPSGDMLEIMLEGIEHIVQHPREAGVAVGTASMAARCLPGSTLVVGVDLDANPAVKAALFPPR